MMQAQRLNTRRIAAVVILALGVLSVLTGLFLDQWAGTFKKAVFICLECIGIG